MPGVGLEPTTTGLTDQKTLLLVFRQNTLIRALSTELPWHMLRQAGVEPAIGGSLFNLAVCDPYSPHFLYRCVDRFTTAADIDFWGKDRAWAILPYKQCPPRLRIRFGMWALPFFAPFHLLTTLFCARLILRLVHRAATPDAHG